MFSVPARQEIDHRTIKLLVGLIALTLPGLTNFFAGGGLTSISASYYDAGWAQSIFVGFLFAISALMLAYNGRSRSEMILSKIASLAGLGIALFPCECVGHEPGVRNVHGISTAVMFLILAYFCWLFLRRAWNKGHARARARAVVYALCGIAILLAIVVLGYNHLSKDALTARIPRLTFYGEATGLIAFGISWLLASRVLPGLTSKDERF